MKLLYRYNVEGHGTRGTPLKITGIDHNGREEFIHEEPTPIQVYKKSKDDIRHDSRIPTPKVFQYYKYMPEDNTRYDAGKPTPGVATLIIPASKEVFQYSKHGPQENMQQSADKPTLGVGTAIAPAG
jgi:hypothetical protein